MLAPQAFGGNIDNKLLSSGAKLYLPVETKGALFSAADPHASQGDGEIRSHRDRNERYCVFKFRVIKEKRKVRYPRAIVNVGSKNYLLPWGFRQTSTRLLR